MISQPWDVSSIPRNGDASTRDTYAAKGLAASLRESAEVSLSHLFSALHGDRPDDTQTAKRYGELLNFSSRLHGLETAGFNFFRANCDQSFEADFDDIVLLAGMFVVRRNEIVHSIVRPVIFDRSFERTAEGDKWTTMYQFYLVPPTYTDRKFDASNRPSFIYTSVEIQAYSNWFGFIDEAAQNLALRLANPLVPPFGRKHPPQDA
jgi:hypothetical protein